VYLPTKFRLHWTIRGRAMTSQRFARWRRQPYRIFSRYRAARYPQRMRKNTG